MNNPKQDHLLHCYDTMTKRLQYAVEHAEKQTIPNVEEKLKDAKEKAIKLGELTMEEADKVGG